MRTRLDGAKLVNHPVRTALIVLGLAAAVLAVYGQLAGAGFINFDDSLYVYENPHVRQGLTGAGVWWAFTTYDLFYWAPLTWLSHMLDCQLFGLQAGGHHLTNVLWHVLNSLLVFLVFRRMTGAVWRSAVLAGLFALHPLRVESVSWIAERKDMLSGFWLFSTLWAYVRYTEKPSNARYGVVLLAMVMGLMSKPMLVTVPLLLLVIDYWPLGRRAFAEKFPMAILAAVSAAVTLIGQHRMGAMGTGMHFSLAHRAANAVVAYASYMGKTIWPQGLSILYPYPASIPAWKTAGAALLLAGITYLAVRLRRTHPYVMAGWVWFLVGLVPTIGLVQVGMQPMADRFTYIPLLGLFLAAVWGAAKWSQAMPRVGAAAAVVVLAACAARSWAQTRTWHDSVTVFSQALAVAEPTCTAHRCLAMGLETQGDIEGALAHYDAAVRLEPANFVAQYYYGAALLGVGRLDEARAHLGEAVRYCPTCAEPYYRLGQLSMRRGDRQEGRQWIAAALDRGLRGEYAASARKELAAAESP